MTRKTSRPLFLFYLLVAYVVLQFCWWTFMIIGLNNQIYQEQLKSSDVHSAEFNEAKKTLEKKWIMIGGEAFVFFTLLIAGMYMVKKSLKKEELVIRQQKNFLLSVTHELKSPLASVRLQAETLKKHQLSKEKQDQVLTNTLNDIDRLDQLVENILLATRIDNPHFAVSKQEVNFSEYLYECIRNFKALYSDAVIINNIPESVYAHIDPLLFRSVILNLLENAYKYGSKEIELTLHESSDKVFITVCDQGTGIPHEERANIFRIFYRIGNEDTRKTKGTGLGLYLVKSITEHHNGSITLKENKPQGAIFEINIPK